MAKKNKYRDAMASSLKCVLRVNSFSHFLQHIFSAKLLNASATNLSDVKQASAASEHVYQGAKVPQLGHRAS